VTRRRRIDLELLLIIRRAERQAQLRGRSRCDEFDALMAVQRAALIDPHVPSRLARPRPPTGWTQGPPRVDRAGGGHEELDRHAERVGGRRRGGPGVDGSADYPPGVGVEHDCAVDVAVAGVLEVGDPRPA
jgi:hypothetical protein